MKKITIHYNYVIKLYYGFIKEEDFRTFYFKTKEEAENFGKEAIKEYYYEYEIIKLPLT